MEWSKSPVADSYSHGGVRVWLAAIVRAVVGPTQQSYHHVVRATEEAQGERQKGGEDVRGLVCVCAGCSKSSRTSVDRSAEKRINDGAAWFCPHVHWIPRMKNRPPGLGMLFLSRRE